jgi:hypothetical protein
VREIDRSIDRCAPGRVHQCRRSCWRSPFSSFPHIYAPATNMSPAMEILRQRLQRRGFMLEVCCATARIGIMSTAFVADTLEQERAGSGGGRKISANLTRQTASASACTAARISSAANYVCMQEAVHGCIGSRLISAESCRSTRLQGSHHFHGVQYP